MTPADAAGHALTSLLQPLAPLAADLSVSEILINGPGAAWYERHGTLWPVELAIGDQQLHTVARLVETLSCTDRLERDRVLEGRWQDWRVTMALPPVCTQACLAMRRHVPVAVPLASWPAPVALPSAAAETVRPVAGAIAGDCRDVAPGVLEVLRAALRRHDNILIAGATGSGKTTLLASLLAETGPRERLVCLEDNPELPRLGPHQLQLYARAGHSLRSLLHLALRLRPDRLALGEVRGGEAFDLLQAMATGHRGCFGTIHARDAHGALARLEQLILTAGLEWPLDAVRHQVAQWIDLVVLVRRTAQGRAIAAVERVSGMADGGYLLEPLTRRVTCDGESGTIF